MANNSCIACAHERSLIYDNRNQHTCEKGNGTSTEGEGGATTYTFWNYQQDTGTTAIYPDAGLYSTLGVNYTILGLIGEAGEIANKWKKYYRDAPSFANDYVAHDDYYNDLRASIISELGDVLWYTSQLARELGVDLGDVAADNIRKLSDRKQRDKLHGSGDDR